MNHLYIPFFLLFFVLFTSGCETEDHSCIEINFEEPILLKKGNSYCFPDGATLEILNLENAFCPCNVICIWEGEMLLHYKIDYAGEKLNQVVGSSENTPSDLIEGVYKVQFEQIEFEEECSENIPSPNILSTTVIISTL